MMKQHEYQMSYSGMVCGAMVTLPDGSGDQCGKSSADPVHIGYEKARAKIARSSTYGLSDDEIARRLATQGSYATLPTKKEETPMKDSLDRIADALNEIRDIIRDSMAGNTGLAPLDNPAPAIPADAQTRADYNRDHAEELFGDKLYLATGGRWLERGTAKPVVFTMYGWIREEDM